MRQVPISKLTLTELVDAYGVVNEQKKELAELEQRIKAQIQLRSNNNKLYGNSYSLTIVSSIRKEFDKVQFIAKYSQKLYDSFCTKLVDRVEFRIKNSHDTPKAKDVPVIRVEVAGVGEISAKAV